METCAYCDAPGYKTDGNCIILCENRAFTGSCTGAIKPIPIVKPITAGRNDKCPCGSGKKYKHCCLNTLSNS